MNMNKIDAEVYKIVVDMAEQLVPDVCALIMAELEQIHIEKARPIWKERVAKINKEYADQFRTYFNQFDNPIGIFKSGFMKYNYRDMKRTTEIDIFGLSSGRAGILDGLPGLASIASLPPNYFFSATLSYA